MEESETYCPSWAYVEAPKAVSVASGDNKELGIFFFCNKLEALFFNLKYLYDRLWNKDSTLQLLSSLLC